MNIENLTSDLTASDEVTLKRLILNAKDWYSYLLSKWLIIVCFGILGAIIGFGYAYLKEPVYTATTTFVLEEGDKAGGLGQYAGLASMVGVDLGGGGGGIFQGDNILELYKSRTMIEKTLLSTTEYEGKKILLVDRYIAFNKLRKKWAEKPLLANIQFNNIDRKSRDRSILNRTRLQDSILGVMVADINKECLVVSKPDKKLSIIKVEVKAIDEFFSKTFNDLIVKNVNDFYVQTKTKKSIENVSILQQKTDSVRAVMNGAIYSSAAVSDATPNLNPTRQIQRVAPMQKSQFTAETNKAVLSELVKNLEMSKISLRKETPLIQVVDDPVLPLEKKKASKLKSILIGGIIVGLITCFILIVRRIFKMMLF